MQNGGSLCDFRPVRLGQIKIIKLMIFKLQLRLIHSDVQAYFEKNSFKDGSSLNELEYELRRS